MTEHKRRKRHTPLLALALVIVGAAALWIIISILLRDTDIALLNPKGVIADEQHWLLVTSTLIMLAFAVPIMLAIYFFAWRYREDNQKTDYSPDTTESKPYLLFAWGGPSIIVIILALIMLPATQRLEPQEPIASDKEQLTVQVVALNWKWLFIYPEQNIASLNFTQIPVDTPVRFELTADGAPMSSFWVPHLGGMLYVMTGHVNPLHLMGDTVGDYPGNSAEINGHGFAEMKFTARVSTQEDFDAWVEEVRQSPSALSQFEYDKLREPSENNPPEFFSNPEPNLYSSIVSKYGGHDHGGEHEGHGGY